MLEDAAIVALYWARDPEAIRESDLKYGTFCQGIAWNILQSREDAEECVNDTWHRAWDTIPPQRPNSLRAYLGRIVRNLSLDCWRRRRAQKRGEGMEVLLSELGDCLPGGRTPEKELEDREITAAIDRWLSGLGESERVLFLRRYWYGDRVDELAAAWGCGANGMAQRLRRLRLSLRRALEREGVWL